MIINQPSSCRSEQDSDSEKKRDWTRFEPNISAVWLLVENEPRLAAAVDESYGGIGLILDLADVAGIQSGDEVTVLYYGHPTQGSVQWIKRDQESPQVRLGIQWLNPTG